MRMSLSKLCESLAATAQGDRENCDAGCLCVMKRNKGWAALSVSAGTSHSFLEAVSLCLFLAFLLSLWPVPSSTLYVREVNSLTVFLSLFCRSLLTFLFVFLSHILPCVQFEIFLSFAKMHRCFGMHYSQSLMFRKLCLSLRNQPALGQKCSKLCSLLTLCMPDANHIHLDVCMKMCVCSVFLLLNHQLSIIHSLHGVWQRWTDEQKRDYIEKMRRT